MKIILIRLSLLGMQRIGLVTSSHICSIFFTLAVVIVLLVVLTSSSSRTFTVDFSLASWVVFSPITLTVVVMVCRQVRMA